MDMKLVLFMYNMHPYFFLKNLARYMHHTWQNMVIIAVFSPLQLISSMWRPCKYRVLYQN